MARLYEGRNHTLANNKYKIRINTTLQASIKILNKCSCLRRQLNKYPHCCGLSRSSYRLKRIFLRKSRDLPLCFFEPWFGFPTFVRTHVTTDPDCIRKEASFLLLYFTLASSLVTNMIANLFSKS